MPNWIDAFATEDSLNILVEGQAKVKAIFVEIPVAFRSMKKLCVEGVFEMMLIREAFRLDLRINGLSQPTIRLSGTTMDVGIEITNSYPFPLTVRSGILELFVSGGLLGRLFLEEGESIMPGETQERTVTLSLNHAGPLAGLFRTALERRVSYEIAGSISVAVGTVDFSLPVERQGIFSLHR